MLYCEIHKELKSAFNNMETEISISQLGIKIRRETFSSGAGEYYEYLPNQDIEIISNNSFDYFLMSNLGNNDFSGIIFLFHGLNEKKWDKYLPWAFQLAKLTGKTIVLFPIAFHMNRAPSEWSNPRLMQKLSSKRTTGLKNSHSSFANAAISERLDSNPHRFLLSGLQTYIDFCRLVKLFRSGKISYIKADASIDLFGYSVGAFFSLLLLMDNPHNLLSDSRLFMFCGGATYDKTFPVSKYIVDSNASTSVSSFFNEVFKNKSVTEKLINGYFENLAPDKSYFNGMMNYELFKSLREQRLLQISERLSVITLEKDEVIMPGEVEDSLTANSRNFKGNFLKMDFDFPYSHVTPFPLAEVHKQQVNNAFNRTMEKASVFLS